MCNEAERSRRGGEPGGGGGSPAQVALAAFQQGIASREHIYIYIYIIFAKRVYQTKRQPDKAVRALGAARLMQKNVVNINSNTVPWRDIQVTHKTAK